MTVNTPDLRTELARVRGLGAAHHGVAHWWRQRITALALIPLSLWFMISLVTALLSPNVVDVAGWFDSPIHSILMVLLLIAAFTHAKLGVEVVIEDYVHKPAPKYALLLLNNFLCVIGAVVCVLAVLKLHLLNMIGTV